MLHPCFVVCSAFATAESVPLESVTPVTHGSHGTSHVSDWSPVSNVEITVTDRLCLPGSRLIVWRLFVFNCPAYSHIRSQHQELLQQCCTNALYLFV